MDVTLLVEQQLAEATQRLDQLVRQEQSLAQQTQQTKREILYWSGRGDVLRDLVRKSKDLIATPKNTPDRDPQRSPDAGGPRSPTQVRAESTTAPKTRKPRKAAAQEKSGGEAASE